MSGDSFDRESVIDLLMRAQTEDRLVVEFAHLDGEIRAIDITDHVAALEEEVNQ